MQERLLEKIEKLEKTIKEGMFVTKKGREPLIAQLTELLVEGFILTPISGQKPHESAQRYLVYHGFIEKCVGGYQTVGL